MSKNKSNVKGIIWLFISKLFPPVINFSVFTYSARVLAPEDFGLIALALAIIFIISSLMPSGWNGALIKYQLDDKISISSVLWLNFIVSLILLVVIILFTFLSIFEFQTATFNSALLVLSIKLVLDGLFNTLNKVLLKQQLYSLIAVRTVVSSVISAIFIVVLLVLDFGVWALIWAQVILSFANFITVYIPTRHLVTFTLCFKTLKSMNSFAVYNTFTGGITNILQHYDSIIIGGILGNYNLGIINISKRLTNILNAVFISTVSDISLPILAAKQKNITEFKDSFLLAVYFSIVCLFPLFAFIILNSTEIIVFLFSAKWIAASVPLQAFSFMFFFIILGIPQKNIIILSNESKWWFYLQLKLSAFILPLATFAAYNGLNYLLIVLVLSKALYCTCSMVKSCRILSLKVSQYLMSFSAPLICCIGASIILYCVKQYLPVFDLMFSNILLLILVYFSLYLILIYLLARKRIVSILIKLFPDNKIIKNHITN